MMAEKVHGDRHSGAPPAQDDGGFTHFNTAGRARMVDVSAKDITRRVAVASGWVQMQPSTLVLVQAGRMAKGDVLAVAQVAGIMAAKRTAELVPMCHPLPLTAVDLSFALDAAANRVLITATVQTDGRTGVEMEALTAVAVAGLTVYDMCKAVDRGMVIGDVRLELKTGGKSGTFRRENNHEIRQGGSGVHQ